MPNSHILIYVILIEVQFPNSVPVTTLLDRPSKFRRQVKQACLPTITGVALGPSYQCNEVQCEVRKYGQDFEFRNYPSLRLSRILRKLFCEFSSLPEARTLSQSNFNLSIKIYQMFVNDHTLQCTADQAKFFTNGRRCPKYTVPSTSWSLLQLVFILERMKCSYQKMLLRLPQ